jgi:hypothetical protein
MGSHVRLKRHTEKSATCSSGWYSLYPYGWACKGEGIVISSSPSTQNPQTVKLPSPQAALPYTYYKVGEEAVPEFHRLPSRDEQRAAQTFVDQYVKLKSTDNTRAIRFMQGELPHQIPKPPVMTRVLDRGFFVAGIGIETRAQRKFIKTVSGQYLKHATLLEYTGSTFQGQMLSATNHLPIAWAVRSAKPLKKRERPDGSIVVTESTTHPDIARHEKLSWVGRTRYNGSVYHELSDGSLLKDWFVAVAEPVKPPRKLNDEEMWIHIDISAQTLVLYRETEPIYATLVSTGLSGHDTPTGEFFIRQKRIAATMADLGADLDARYNIEDVPWTQYLKGSIALHGAFWHTQFGLRHSHGCINLAPIDAHMLFDRTKPQLPPGWHGIVAQHKVNPGSLVWITD